MTRPRTLTLAVLLALAGCGSTEPAAVPSPTPTIDPAIVAECVAVQRAYNAWAGSHATVDTSTKALELNEDTVKWTMETGDTFADAIDGYDDHPAKALTAAAAEYNLEVATVNAWLTIGKPLTDQQVEDLIAAAQKTHAAYRDFKAQTCAGV